MILLGIAILFAGTILAGTLASNSEASKYSRKWLKEYNEWYIKKYSK